MGSSSATAISHPNIAFIKYLDWILDGIYRKVFYAANLWLADVFFQPTKINNRHEARSGTGFTACPIFNKASAVLIGNLGLPFEIYIDQEAFIPLTPER